MTDILADEFIVTAYHEAAHAVIARLYDRWCEINMTKDDKNHGGCGFNDAGLFEKIKDPRTSIEAMRNDKYWRKIAVENMHTYLAGYIAECIYTNLNVELGDDIDKALIINKYFDFDYEKIFDDVEKFLQKTNVWELIKEIAEL